MKKFLPLVLIICLTLVAFQCEDDPIVLSQEEEQAELNVLKTEIETLANTSSCNNEAICKFIAFGSKPCGGPWNYLIYSTSIDTNKLENLVKEYNQREKDFNTKWSIVSDCAVALPPTSLECENNMCLAIY